MTDPEDNSAELRGRAEDDAIRAGLLTVLTMGESTEKFSTWLLAVGGGFVALQFSAGASVATHAPRLMLAATFITIVSLFVGAMVRLMTYSAGHLTALWGGPYPAQVEAIRDRYGKELMDLAKYLHEQGRQVPALIDMDQDRINRHVITLTDVKQRRMAHWLFEAADTLTGWMCGTNADTASLDPQWQDIGRATRLSTAAQVWVVVQLLLIMIAVAVAAVAYAVAALH